MHPDSTPAAYFSGKSALYDQYRWDYDKRVADAILQPLSAASECRLADIGAGTGMLSRHLIDKVAALYAIEPNQEMRDAAGVRLGGFSNFHNIDGYAHATTLPDDSVDCIAIGRAIHWFEPQSSKLEFQRILRPPHWLAIARNPCADEALLDALGAISCEANGARVAQVDRRKRQVPIEYYFGKEGCTCRDFHFQVTENWQAFFARICSLSTSPNADHPRFSRFESAAKEVFDTFADCGQLLINAKTEVFIGRMY